MGAGSSDPRHAEEWKQLARVALSGSIVLRIVLRYALA